MTTYISKERYGEIVVRRERLDGLRAAYNAAAARRKSVGRDKELGQLTEAIDAVGAIENVVTASELRQSIQRKVTGLNNMCEKIHKEFVDEASVSPYALYQKLTYDTTELKYVFAHRHLDGLRDIDKINAIDDVIGELEQIADDLINHHVIPFAERGHLRSANQMSNVVDQIDADAALMVYNVIKVLLPRRELVYDDEIEQGERQ